jgi:hypothetical protein
MISVLYVLGYLSWSAYAYDNHFGLLPALDAQYFAAGVLPALVCVLTVCCIYLVRAIARWSSQAPSPVRRNVARVLGATSIVLIVLGFGLSRISNTPWFAPLLYGGVFMIYLDALIQGSSGNRFLRGVALVGLYASVVLIPLWLLFTIPSPKMEMRQGG